MCVCVCNRDVRTAYLKLQCNHKLGEAFSRFLQSACEEGVRHTHRLGGQSSLWDLRDTEGPAELLEAGGACPALGAAM